MKKQKYIVFSLIIFFAFFNVIFFPFNFCKNVVANESSENFTNLIVFLRFKDEDEFVNNICGETTTVKQLIENSYSLADFSVKDYYYRVSNGKVNMQNVYLFLNDGGSLMLNNKRGYYYENQGSNEIGYDSSQYELRLSELQQDWANAITTALDSGCSITNLNQTKTYKISDLDKDNNGTIDNITLFYKYSDEFGSTWKGCLWNYQSYSNRIELLSEKNTTITSHSFVQITYDYNLCYTTDNKDIKFTSLKTMIHETGHAFGLKDLYNTNSDTPIYYMSVMAKSPSHIPQYISAKEREALGWLNQENVSLITTAGQYTIKVTSSEIASGIICYKLDIPSSNKTLYLEYRKFDGNINKYDSQNKQIYVANGDILKNITIKSGLVCYLLDKDTLFPNNMNCNKYNWNYQVLGGQYSTKTDSALTTNDSLLITSNLSVEVLSVTDNDLTFKVVGTDISQEHTHSLEKVEFKDSTCLNLGNIEYYKCTSCNKYFLSNNTEIEYNDTIIEKKQHTPETINGKEPTCKNEGLTDGSKCSVCGTILQQQNTISKLNHVESDWIIDKDSTTTETGTKHKECVNCGEVLETQIIPLKEINDNPTEPDNPPKQENKNTIILLLSIGLPAIIITIAIFVRIGIFIKRKRRW